MDKSAVLADWISPSNTPVTSTEQFAPSNIALCKYWGKRDKQLNLPMNASLSVSLGHLGTHTRLVPIDYPTDEIWLNSDRLLPSSPFCQRVSAFLDLFRQPGRCSFRVTTRNSIPTAAGLASSASGFAALAKAANESFALDLNTEQLSVLARLGSGSACRSVFKGFVEWQMGQRDDGLDSHGVQLPVTWPGLCVGLIKVDASEKSTDSRSGMQRTVDTAHLYQSWPVQAAHDLEKLKQALASKDFERLGQTAEHNALAMHATMIASWPPLVYWQPESLAMMQRIWKLRKEGLSCYFTMDAGPNLKLLFLQTELDALMRYFPEMEVIQPFGHG
ncbi:diphosphomevalonate decarboxylase [Nitrincola schmidtii]|uniref:diphosphomevalonate decarboxylase n=1 Tax=Nitrincola schmidtii TaxID=1730894 RepID=UPI00197EB9EE|nr:diphosphomevalonate decarboxylase [Nitrincola schmidtii]